jgi:hypothetical protein
VNAMLTDSSFPCITYTKNDTTETRIGEQTQSRENITEFRRAMHRPWGETDEADKETEARHKDVPLTIHSISTSRASNVRLIHCSSHAKNLINFTYTIQPAIRKQVWQMNNTKRMRLTDPINSFRTPILLSLAVEEPFWMRTLRFIKKELRGQPTIRTTKPAKADQPRSLRVELMIKSCSQDIERTCIGRYTRGLSPVELTNILQSMKKYSQNM